MKLISTPFCPEDQAHYPGVGQVHVWCVDLADAAIYRDMNYVLLNEAERARVASFVVAPAREQCTDARGVLRRVLARYLQCEPASVVFSYGDYGKPYLGAGSPSSLQFNLSHTCGFMVIACVDGIDVGVDCESMVRKVDFMAIAKQKFSEGEYQYLGQLRGEALARAFWRLWVAKEACMKVSGLGMTMGLDAFSFQLEEKGLLTYDTGSRAQAFPTLAELPFQDRGYCGVLAVDGDIDEVLCQHIGVGNLVGAINVG